nr:transposase [Desulfotomaculum nigrificans]
MEPTGHYWLKLASIIKEHSMKIVLVNPFHVKRSKELDDNNPTKNDGSMKET